MTTFVLTVDDAFDYLRDAASALESDLFIRAVEVIEEHVTCLAEDLESAQEKLKKVSAPKKTVAVKKYK